MPVQRVGENRRSLELRNSHIPRIFRNNLAYEDDTDSQFTCILRNFGLEHGFVHLQRAGWVQPTNSHANGRDGSEGFTHPTNSDGFLALCRGIDIFGSCTRF